MSTNLELLQERKTAIITALASAGTAPDYSIDGQSVQRSANRRALLEELRTINELISLESGSFEIETHGIV